MLADSACVCMVDVMCRVVEVSFDERGPRTGCSMKVVDQKTGSDLDPQVSPHGKIVALHR